MIYGFDVNLFAFGFLLGCSLCLRSPGLRVSLLLLSLVQIPFIWKHLA